MFDRILIVCVGNICRSPMAEFLLAHQMPGTEVHSAGLAAMVGEPADSIAQELMRERGIDISAHCARQLTPEMVMEHDLVLAMEIDHVQSILNLYPYARGKVHLLGKWINEDIPDPYRKSNELFRHTLDLIDRSLYTWQIRLKAGAANVQ